MPVVVAPNNEIKLVGFEWVWFDRGAVFLFLSKVSVGSIVASV